MHCGAGRPSLFVLKGLIKSPASADRKQLTVEVHTKVLTEEPMYKTVTLFGQTNAAAKIVVVNKYAGMITDVQKDLGDRVSAGDVLAQQDLKDINIQVNRAEADYKSYDAYTERYDATFNSNYQKYISEYNLKKQILTVTQNCLRKAPYPNWRWMKQSSRCSVPKPTWIP